MESYQELVEDLLRTSGAKLIRKKKHSVWLLPSGKKWVTPNSHRKTGPRTWENNFRELKLLLGIRPSIKSHKDFEHQKNEEEYVKKHEKQEVLQDTVLDVIPSPPPAPTKLERAQMELIRKAEEEREKEEARREIFSVGGQFPLILKRGGKHSGGRTGRMYTFSPEVLAHANFLRAAEGEDASKKYLDGVRFGIITAPKTNEDEEMKMELEIKPNGSAVVGAGKIEEALAEAEREVLVYKKQEQEARLQWMKAEATVKCLREAFGIKTATGSALRSLLAEANVVSTTETGEAPRRIARKGFWKEAITEILATSPVPLDKRALITEMTKVRSVSKDAAGQSMYKGLQDGWIKVRDDGSVCLNHMEG